MSVEAYLNEARGHDGEWVSGSATDAIESAVGRATGDAATHLVNTGIAPDTKTAHTNAKGEYSPERAKLHQAIIEHFMAGTQPHSKPEAIFTAGGAASGKSGLAGRADTVRNPGANLPVPRGHVYVNPDDIKQMLPEYDELSADGHSEIAAAATHEESSDIAKLLTAIAVKRQRHLVIDGTGNSQVGKFGDKLRAAKAAGYKVTARYAHIPVEEAIAREAARAQRTGRKVDEDVLRKQHQVVSQSFSQDVKDIPGINTEIYSTLGRGKPTLIASKPERGQMRVLKPSQYKQMIQKGSA
jgi:predicted ABC-type ATPase